MASPWINTVYNDNYSAHLHNSTQESSMGSPANGTYFVDIKISPTPGMDNFSAPVNRCLTRSSPDGLQLFRIIIDVFVVGLLCLVGFVGNALSIAVLRRDRDKKNTTNWLLQTLAVSDTLYLFASVFIQTLKTIKDFTNWWPGLQQAFPYFEPYIWPFASITQTITVWLVMLVTADRYIAVCKPLQTQMRTLQRTKLAVAIVVITAILYNVPRFMEREITTTFNECTNRTEIISKKTALREDKVYFLVYKTIMYFIFRAIGPLVILIVLNLRLIKALQEVRRKHRDLTRTSKHRENITLMLVVVVSVFILCEIPDLTLRILFTIMTFSKSIKIDITLLRYINVCTNAMLTLNSGINFLIYCLIGNKFRKILWEMCCWHIKGVSEVSETEPLTARTQVTADPKNGTVKTKTKLSGSKSADVEL